MNYYLNIDTDLFYYSATETFRKFTIDKIYSWKSKESARKRLQEADKALLRLYSALSVSPIFLQFRCFQISFPSSLFSCLLLILQEPFQFLSWMFFLYPLFHLYNFSYTTDFLVLSSYINKLFVLYHIFYFKNTSSLKQ